MYNNLVAKTSAHTASNRGRLDHPNRTAQVSPQTSSIFTGSRIFSSNVATFANAVACNHVDHCSLADKSVVTFASIVEMHTSKSSVRYEFLLAYHDGKAANRVVVDVAVCFLNIF